MPITKFKTVKDYIASKPRDVQALLNQLQGAIRKAVPDAEEMISYQMPSYKLRGVYLLFFAAWKKHISLYPAGDALVENFKHELSQYKRTKGMIQFPLSEPVPVSLIEQIAKFRGRPRLKPVLRTEIRNRFHYLRCWTFSRPTHC